MSYIDAHVHVWTDDYDRYPFGDQHSPEGANPKIFLADDILGHARPCGVERVVLVQMSYYQTDNSYMLDVMAEHPGVFSGIGVVDVGDSKPDEEMLRLAKRGVCGFRISAGTAPESWLERACFAPEPSTAWRCAPSFAPRRCRPWIAAAGSFPTHLSSSTTWVWSASAMASSGRMR